MPVSVRSPRAAFLRLGLAFLAGLCIGWVHAQEPLFAPAFTPEAVDFEQSKQFVNGQAAPADPLRIKKVLGFADSKANGQEQLWEAEAAEGRAENEYRFLIVLKAPVAVGSLAIHAADWNGEGSRSGGEVFCLKPDVQGVPDALQPEGWIAVEFASAQPFLRFAALPPGLSTRAFLYNDVRASGPAQLGYWRFYKHRMASLTPLARGFSDSTSDAQDPDALPKGAGWSGGKRAKKLSAQDPAWAVLAWEVPHPIAGVFLYSNATVQRIQRLKPDVQTHPAIAPDDDWEAVQPIEDAAVTHGFQHWAFSYRWCSFAPAPTRALRVTIEAVDRGGPEPWINGCGAFVDLKSGSPPAPRAQDDRPPMRIPYSAALDGEVSAVIDSAAGLRVRNLFAQRPLAPGSKDEAWDLKDENGNYVEPGTYRFKAIGAPPVELAYRLTPYPNVDQVWPDRTPWLTGHGGANGWLSDHSPFWACATRGDRVYFGSSMAEAGVCFIECDLNGKKQWGRHDFGPWIGVGDLAADAEAVYINAHGTVYRMDAQTREIKKLFQYGGGGREWQYRAMAAHGGKIYLTFGAGSASWFENAAGSDLLDQQHCLPQPDLKNEKHLLPFLLRMGGHVPGRDVDPSKKTPMGQGRVYLESTHLKEQSAQHIVLAFKQPIPLGSLVFPKSDAKETMTLSVLKAGAPYPPRPDHAADWTPIDVSKLNAWDCVAAPANCETRAVRFTWTGDDLLPAEPWMARLEGLKLLRRRFANLASTAKARVNSGAVKPDGSWDAQREQPLSDDAPGLYVLEWAQPQKLRGLAIKEIEAAVTEIDVWLDAPGPVPLEGPACEERESKPGWRHVATYKQRRRTAQYKWTDNPFARYLDGYVDFGAEFETRAVRLRVVRPWYDNGEDNECARADGPLEHGVHLTQSHIVNLDTRRCRIRGIAALSYLGGEKPVVEASVKRVGVYDGQTGAALKELPAALGWHGLSCGPDGRLFAIREDHRAIVEVDRETGALTEIVKDCSPSVMTVGPDGHFYVWPWINDGKEPIHVYDGQGQLVRTIGKPGGMQPGAWDAQRFGKVHRLCSDTAGSLWVLESQNEPRRIVQYKTDGTFVKEILGNTNYGGGGTLNRFDKSRAYFGRVEFELDWTRHTSRIRGLMAKGLESDLLAYKLGERTYLATAPLMMHPTASRGVVYLYDEASGTVRRVAAMGDATGYDPLMKAPVLALLKGEVPKHYLFVWSDLDGNGEVDPPEVRFEKKGEAHRYGGVNRFDEKLGCVAFGSYYSVKEVLPNGTPVFESKALPGPANFALGNNTYVGLHRSASREERTVNYALDAVGKTLWQYPAGGGVSGLSIPPWTPGLVANQFAIIGHETMKEGALGEFFVTHGNTGQWWLWTSDGLLAGQILSHKGDARARFFGPAEAKPGMRLDPLSGNQEHFHGFFTRSEADGKFYAIAGFTFMSVMEVRGLEKFKRAEAEFQVTAEDLERVRAWEANQQRRRIEGRPMLIQAQALHEPPVIDGKRGKKEWGAEGVRLRDDVNATLDLGYDEFNLYVCLTAIGTGPLKNAADDVRRCFKTGACLDLQIGTNASAAPARGKPVDGDQRLLITFVKGKPLAVLYQAFAKGAKPDEAWKAFTPAGGETAFERVIELKNLEIAMGGASPYTLEASIPLSALGLKPKPGLRLKFDWGLLTSNDGVQVKERIYWSNRMATGTSDEAIEARLEPALWGYLGF